MFFYEERGDIDRGMFAVEERRNFSYPMHIHRWYEVALVSEGELDVVLNGETHTLLPGDSIFIFPNQPHAYVNRADSRHTLCLFKPEIIAFFNTKMKGKIPRCPQKHVDDKAWESVFRSLSNDSPIERVKGALYIYCGFFANDEFVGVAESGIPDDLDLIHRIFVFAADHYTEKCSLSDLAAGIGYDYSYLSKFFSDKIGSSFTEYVGRLRLDRARYLLENTAMSVLDVSESCGYGSLRSFNRNFHKAVGLSPREYRKTLGKIG